MRFPPSHANALSREASAVSAALRGCRRGLVDVAIFSIAINLLMLVPSFYMMQVYDRVLASRSVDTLIMLTLVVIFLFGIMAGLDWVRSRLLVRLGNRFDEQLQQRLHQSLYRQALTNPSAASIQGLDDLATLRQFFSSPAVPAFLDTPWIPVYLGILTLFHPYYGLFALCAGALLLALAVLNEARTRQLLKQAGARQVSHRDTTAANLRNSEVLHALGMVESVQHRWQAIHREGLTLLSLASDRAGTLTHLSKALRLLSQSLILGLGAWLVLVAELTPGMMIAGSILLGRALAPLDQLINGWKSFIAARNASERLNTLIGAATPGEPMALPCPRGSLTLENVSAGPPGSQDITLKAISLTLSPGEQLAVVGPSGSGKSTLARVVLGIWPRLDGCVRLDGADILGWKRQALGPHLGYLPQDVELLAGTIADNIARFATVDAEAVVKAAILAGVHELILSLDDGYDTVIGPQGLGLSAGQRQRIGLARALYGHPCLVVLDEPDASLDDAGERALAQALDGLRRQGTTTLVITHRQCLLDRVDRILTLREGQVAALRARRSADGGPVGAKTLPGKVIKRVTPHRPASAGGPS
ncbi:type I secretion system permease/ATPase [Halomonas cupida]|uniref:type I secretion system permease/ATPase n=1 Tax=Halomonas cupida TaxID=44933 RepID=UPI003EF1DC5B